MKRITALNAFRKAGLTSREADVLLWITRGKSNAEIGEVLGISFRTVKKHLEHIFAKLRTRSRLAASARASGICSVQKRA